MEPANTAADVMLVDPTGFGFDPETEEDNEFQARPEGTASDAARREFDGLVEALESKGVGVHVRPAPQGCPDAVFPNNWFSTHSDGTLCLYPMRARSRRAERSPETVAWLRRTWPNVVDLSPFEEEGEFLEGTGSLVLDRAMQVAFAARSPRTHERLVELWCEQAGYQPVVFDAASPTGTAVYHTNVVLALGSGWALFCAEAVPESQARLVSRILRGTGREVVEVGWGQARAMACNAIELRVPGGPLAVVGEAGWESLDPGQRRAVESRAGVLLARVPTFERVGGGGVRCMLAELYVPEGRALARAGTSRG